MTTLGAQSLHNGSFGVDGLPLPRHQLTLVKLNPSEGAQAIEDARVHLQIANGTAHKAALVEVGGQWQHRSTSTAKVYLLAGIGDAGRRHVHGSNHKKSEDTFVRQMSFFSNQKKCQQ